MHTVKALIILATFFISKYFKKIALLFNTDTEKKTCKLCEIFPFIPS